MHQVRPKRSRIDRIDGSKARRVFIERLWVAQALAQRHVVTPHNPLLDIERVTRSSVSPVSMQMISVQAMNVLGYWCQPLPSVNPWVRGGAGHCLGGAGVTSFCAAPWWWMQCKKPQRLGLFDFNRKGDQSNQVLGHIRHVGESFGRSRLSSAAAKVWTFTSNTGLAFLAPEL